MSKNDFLFYRIESLYVYEYTYYLVFLRSFTIKNWIAKMRLLHKTVNDLSKYKQKAFNFSEQDRFLYAHMRAVAIIINFTKYRLSNQLISLTPDFIKVFYRKLHSANKNQLTGVIINSIFLLLISKLRFIVFIVTWKLIKQQATFDIKRKNFRMCRFISVVYSSFCWR